jgi:elongation factor G
MLDEVCAFDDDVMEKFLEGEEPTEEEIHRCIRNGVNSLELTPVFMGSAFKNKGVQPLMNAVARYLPSPLSL